MGANTQNKFTGGYDLRFQQLCVELVDKEAKLRLDWCKKYMGKVYENVPRRNVPEKAAQLMKELHEERARTMAGETRAGRKSIVFPVIYKADAGALLPIMKPVEHEVRALLYSGVSHDGDGRIKYINTRYKTLCPQKRYYFTETTSFAYGWFADEMGAEALRPQFGRSSKNVQLFYRRYGVHEDRMSYRPIMPNTPATMERI